MYHCLGFGYWKKPQIFVEMELLRLIFEVLEKFSGVFCMWKSFGCCFFCDGVAILISVPIHCFSEPHLDTKTDWFWFGCPVSGTLQSFRTWILNPEWNQEDLKSLLLFLVPYPSCCWLLFLPLLKLHDLEEEDKLSPPKVCLFPPHIKFTLWPSALCICAPKSALCRGR